MNVQAQPQVRASIGSTGDVLMIDATAIVVAAADIGETAAGGTRRRREFSGRTVMRAGVWLDEPVD